MTDTATSTKTESSASTSSQSRPRGQGHHSKLVTESGSTSISDSVVAKIAALAAREIPGVYSMGTAMSRRVGQLKQMVPGSSDTPTHGVAVEVGEREAALDLDIVTWYGQNIVDISDAVRTNVIDRVQDMTGLKVVEVNINVDDIFVEGESKNGGNGKKGDKSKESRVQ